MTPVTSSASTIDTSGMIASGSIDGLRGGGVGGVDDRDRDLPSILTIVSYKEEKVKKGNQGVSSGQVSKCSG